MKPKDFIFGRGLKDFKVNINPTIADVMKNYIYFKDNQKSSEARNNVCDNILRNWKKIHPSLHSNEIMTPRCIKAKIESVWSKRMKIQKIKCKKEQANRLVDYRKICSNIFEIRKTKISLKKRKLIKSSSNFNPISSIQIAEDSETDEDSDMFDTKNDLDFVKKSEKNSLKLKHSSEMADRYKLSDRAFGALATSVLVDVGIIEKNNKSLIIDKSKARRSRLRERKIAESNVKFDGLALFFDGRKDLSFKAVNVLGM